MTLPSWSGKQWQCRCCEHAWWPSPSPQPPSSPALRERKGGYAHIFPRAPVRSLTGSGRGGYAHIFPRAPFLSPTGSGRGGSRRSSDPASASCNDAASIRSPLSRSAGEGPGVRAARSAGEGPGVRAVRSAGAGLGVRATALLLHRSGCRLTEGIHRRINHPLWITTG